MNAQSQIHLLMAALPDLHDAKLGDSIPRHKIAQLCITYLSKRDLQLTENLVRRCAPWCSYLSRPIVLPEAEGLAQSFILFSAQLMACLDEEHPELAPEGVNAEQISELLKALQHKEWLLAEQMQEKIRIDYLYRKSLTAKGLEQLHLYLLTMLIYARWEKLKPQASKEEYTLWTNTFNQAKEEYTAL